MRLIDYCIAMGDGRIAPPVNLDLATIQQQELANTFRFNISQYLKRRAKDWMSRRLRIGRR
jgi:amidase